MKIELSDEQFRFHLPSIIRITLGLLDRFIAMDAKRLVIVLPEGNLSPFLLLTFKIVSDILEGRIKSMYDPYAFRKGQKLKCGNCVVEFDRIDSLNGTQMLYVRNAECLVGVPIEAAPMFQLTDTKRRLSKDAQFSKIKKILREQKKDEDAMLLVLTENKTHFDNTVFGVLPIGNTQNYINTININGRSINELLLVGKADDEGVVEVIGKGQLQGKPAIVIASNLYAVCEAIKKEEDVKMLMIDISNETILSGQLDALDDLKARGFPIVCVTDTANSFNLSTLEDRDFFVWRWDKESLIEPLLTGNTDPIVEKAKICAKQNVHYIEGLSPEIDELISMLYKMKRLVKDSTGSITLIYEKLFSLAFQYIRSLTPLSPDEKSTNTQTLGWCTEKLIEAERFCDPELHAMITKVIDILEFLNSANEMLPKVKLFRSFLLGDRSTKCCIIPEKANKERYISYWYSFCLEENIIEAISFVTPDEYIGENGVEAETTVVCGWIGKEKMRQIIYGYKTENVVVFLYGYEKRWQVPHITSWNNALHSAGRKKMFDKVLLPQNILIAPTIMETPIETPDELEEINMFLRENQYKHYSVGGGTRPVEETSEAIPVNYIGGYFSFYKPTHKLLSVGDIILKGKNEIQMIYPMDLSVGDFIIVREAQRDLIKEMADKILTASGVEDKRKIVTKWRESLEVDSVSTSFDNLYDKLREAGCSKTKYTVRQWIRNEDIITPQNKADLTFIAQATGDAILKELADVIYEAGKVVKSAHVQAGRNLSVLLKNQIALKLKEIGKIDPYNIWEPIDIQIDGIGNAKLLKVIDIGRKMTVDNSNINRLIRES